MPKVKFGGKKIEVSNNTMDELGLEEGEELTSTQMDLVIRFQQAGVMVNAISKDMVSGAWDEDEEDTV